MTLHPLLTAVANVNRLDPYTEKGRAALQALSKDSLDGLRSQLTPGDWRQRAERWGGLFNGVWVLGAFAYFLGVLVRPLVSPGSHGLFNEVVLPALVLMGVLMAPTTVLHLFVFRPLQALRQLEPLSRSEVWCDQALGHVNVSARARDYRDVVVPRRELTALDLTALALLAAPAHLLQRMERARALEANAERLCRELHQVSYPAPSPSAQAH